MSGRGKIGPVGACAALAAGRGRVRTALAALAVALAALGSAAHAEPPILLSDARPSTPDSLATGEQLLLSQETGPLRFAGRDLQLTNFSGVIGYANDVAYVVVVEGAVRDGARQAAAGRMLLLPPYGAPAGVQRYDAGRLARQWSGPARAARPQAFSRLNLIASSQSSGLFFGRLSRTSFNAAAPAGARREMAGRALLGAPAVRAIRFDGQSDAASVERRIVTAFRDALAVGDAETVAALMDPTPFGGRALAGGAREARLLSARGLIASRDWRASFAGADPAPGQGFWQVGSLRLTLRNVDDFTFVRTIEGGVR